MCKIIVFNQENFDQDILINPPPINCKNQSRSGAPTVEAPGPQPWKISLKTCNFVTLACKRGSTQNTDKLPQNHFNSFTIWQKKKTLLCL